MLLNSRSLIWINQFTSLDDDGLGIAIEWIQVAAIQFSKVSVISHRCGRLPKLPNVEFYSLDEYTSGSRILKLVRLNYLLVKIILRTKPCGIFTHMVPVFGIFSGIWGRIFSIKAIQWYAHGITTIPLIMSSILNSKVVTASKESISLKSDKVEVWGHSINAKLYYQSITTNSLYNFPKIVTIGRISQAKNIDLMIDAIYYYKRKYGYITLDIYGSCRGSTFNYKAELEKKINDLNLSSEVKFKGSLSYTDVPSRLTEYDFFINLSDTNSIDKAVLEAIVNGRMTLTSNRAFKDIYTNHNKDFFIEFKDPNFIADNIYKVFSNGKMHYLTKMKYLQNYIVENHNICNLSRKLAQEFNA